MSAEFILTFQDDQWYPGNKGHLEQQIVSLSTFSRERGGAFELASREPEPSGDDWEYDVRLFLQASDIFIEIATHPPSIEHDLSSLFAWIRQHTPIFIRDDDGEDSNW